MALQRVVEITTFSKREELRAKRRPILKFSAQMQIQAGVELQE
jgi:hypothetical protein